MLSAETEDWIRRRGGMIVAAAALVVGLWSAASWWNRPPAVEFDNLKYIQLLTTAVSAQNAEWLAKVDQAVKQRHESGEMSDRELEAFRRIFSAATAENWKEAELACDRLARAQLSRRRARPPEADDHNHEHSHARPAARLVAN